MKRAVGEVSSAVIVVFAVAILIAFFYYTVWPLISNNFNAQTSCDKAVCDINTKKDGKVECTIPGQEGTFWCNYKG
jgi:predicted permease